MPNGNHILISQQQTSPRNVSHPNNLLQNATHDSLDNSSKIDKGKLRNSQLQFAPRP